MKRLLFFFGLVLILNLVSAQDTIVLKDGSSVLAKILDIDADGVHYKTWSNQNGPTWTKSYKSIKSIKRQVAEVKSKSKIVKSEPKKEVSDLELFENAVTAANEDDIIRYGQAYLNAGEEAELPRVAQTLALIYAARGDQQNSTMYIEKLKKYSSDNDDMFDEDIAKLQKETYALLHPRRVEDDMKGKWVLLENVSYKGTSRAPLYSPIILDIKDVTRSNGAYMITPEQRIPRQTKVFTPSLAYNKQINNSQALAFNGQNKYAAIQFASLVIKDRRGNTDLAHTLLEDSRKMSAEMNATIKTSKASIEDKLAASALTALTTTAIDVLAHNINTSSKTDEVYNMVLFPKNDNVMNSYVSHVSATTYTSESSDPRTVYNEYVKDKRMQFVRWEESDSIFFVSANKKPITLGSVAADDPLLDEYWQIKKRYSLRDPRYYLPLIGGNIIGIIILKKGLNLKEQSYLTDMYGSRIPNGTGGFMLDKKMSSKASMEITFGMMCCLLTTEVCLFLPITKREKPYMDINRRNIEKLRQKAKASMTVSPTYSAENNAMGAAVNITF